MVGRFFESTTFLHIRDCCPRSCFSINIDATGSRRLTHWIFSVRRVEGGGFAGEVIMKEGNITSCAS